MNINLIMPDVPTPLLILLDDESTEDFQKQCTDLWVSIVHEMMDIEYMSRAHHNVGTYDRGCRGPLCRKALREHPRRASQGLVRIRKERAYDPILEYFHTVVKHRIRKYQLDILEELN